MSEPDVADLREQLSRRVACLDALLMFGLARFEPHADEAARIYHNARRMLAERRRNNAVDALMCLETAEESEHVR